MIILYTIYIQRIKKFFILIYLLICIESCLTYILFFALLNKNIHTVDFILYLYYYYSMYRILIINIQTVCNFCIQAFSLSNSFEPILYKIM